jgi:hypothetical protein
MEVRKAPLKRLGLNDALTYLGSFAKWILLGSMNLLKPTPVLNAVFVGILLNRHFGLLF